MAGSSPERTRAYVCEAEMLRISATSDSSRKRASGMASRIPPVGRDDDSLPSTALTCSLSPPAGPRQIRPCRDACASIYARVHFQGHHGGDRVTEPVSPPARRLGQPSWFDPRLVLGVLFILVSVLLGARLVALAQRSVTVWGLARNVAAGNALAAADLEPVKVRLFGHARYYVSSDSAVAGESVNRDLAGGDLLPRSALLPAPDGQLVTVTVSGGSVPPGLARGARADVYATPKATGGAPPGTSARILAAAPVEAVRRPAGGLIGSTSGTVAVVLRVPAGAVQRLVTALHTADIDVVESAPGTAQGDVDPPPSPSGPSPPTPPPRTAGPPGSPGTPPGPAPTPTRR